MLARIAPGRDTRRPKSEPAAPAASRPRLRKRTGRKARPGEAPAAGKPPVVTGLKARKVGRAFFLNSADARAHLEGAVAAARKSDRLFIPKRQRHPHGNNLQSSSPFPAALKGRRDERGASWCPASPPPRYSLAESARPENRPHPTGACTLVRKTLVVQRCCSLRPVGDTLRAAGAQGGGRSLEGCCAASPRAAAGTEP